MMETGFDREKHFSTGHNSYYSQYPYITPEYVWQWLSLYNNILNEVFYNDLVWNDLILLPNNSFCQGQFMNETIIV